MSICGVFANGGESARFEPEEDAHTEIGRFEDAGRVSRSSDGEEKLSIVT